MTSLATLETLISPSLDDGNVIDAKEFQKLQTLYLQENFQKTIMDEIVNLKKALERK